MFRLIAATALSLMPSFAAALCNGPSYWDSLTQQRQATLTLNASMMPYSEGLFWRATRGGDTLTIVGTMHLPDPRHTGLAQVIAPFWGEADLLLVEATMQDQRDMQIYLSQNPHLMTINDGPTLPELLEPPLWDSIKDAAAARQVPGIIAAKMQPWFLAMTLAVPPCALPAMAMGEGGLDTILMADAAEAGVPVAPLEAWQDTLALLMSGTFDEQLDALRMGLIPADQHDAVMVALKDLYFSGQTGLVWEMGREAAALVPSLDQATVDTLMAQMEQDLLTARNRAWIPVIEAAAREHDEIIIGFGAAHLIGEEGVLQLLVDAGWTVARF